jgi:hypothetical protein
MDAPGRAGTTESDKEIPPMPSTEEELKKAYKAFKKRLKLTQLDEDSRLGHSPLTGNRTKIVSIQPPLGFGREIWEELAEKGYLRRDSGGFYELGDKDWSGQS